MGDENSKSMTYHLSHVSTKIVTPTFCDFICLTKTDTRKD